MKIVGHCLVKNEERFVWYAINSTIDFLDELIICDNGSCDRTVQIIQSIKNPKIKFYRDFHSVEIVRQDMLSRTKSDWIFLLDGDEVWYEEGIKNLCFSDAYDTIVCPTKMLIGDIFHYQEEKAGRYKIAGKVGHYNVRGIRFTPGLHLEGKYPNESFVNRDGVKVQDLDQKKIYFSKIPYLHGSYLKKNKYEIGNSFPRDFYYPEVFFRSRPNFIPTLWRNSSWGYKLKAYVQTPLKKIKRRIW